MTALPTLLAGLLVGLTLIIAIGAQNVFVLRQGLRREHIGAVIAICTLSDVALIAAGTAGLGAVVSGAPHLLTAVRWVGAAFLLVNAALAAHRALAPGGDGLVAAEAPPARGLLPVAATTLALTWLNPHVYLDTVLMLGSVAASHGDQRWTFALGAMLGSLAWFTTLGLGARRLGPLLRSRRSWRVVDALVALTMGSSAVALLAA